MGDTILNRNAPSGCAGVILAGGRSRRMGGGMKALLPLDGTTLLQHVIDRVVQQVGPLYLSVETPVAEFEPYKLEQIPDPRPGSNGPLGGLLAALQRAARDGREWLLLVPCDAPFLPFDLAARLLGQAEQAGADVVVVRHASRLQPTFSLWGRSALVDIELAVMEAGMAGFMQFLAERRHAVLDWRTSKVNPFFNINDPAALEHAAKIIAKNSSKSKEE